MMDGSTSSVISKSRETSPPKRILPELLRPLDLRARFCFLLCRINMHLRLVTASEGTTFKTSSRQGPGILVSELHGRSLI